MSNYKSQLQSNNLDLQTVLQTLQTKTANIEKAFEDGKQAEYDAFWDAAQTNPELGNTTGSYAFAGNGWIDANFRPKRDIVVLGGNAEGLFRNSRIENLKQCIEDCGVILDLSSATKATNTFSYSRVTILPKLNFSSAAHMVSTFDGCGLLKTIEELKVSPQAIFTSTFSSCTSLERMIVTGTIGQNGFNVQWSTLLDKESITSIINALSTTTSNLSITLSQAAVNTAFETSTGAANGSTSTEWTTLAGTKSNWTINLV
jgi:hypothetical protein